MSIQCNKSVKLCADFIKTFSYAPVKTFVMLMILNPVKYIE